MYVESAYTPAILYIILRPDPALWGSFSPQVDMDQQSYLGLHRSWASKITPELHMS